MGSQKTDQSKTSINIKVSEHSLTRCQGCSRYHQIDLELPSHKLLALSCDFCGAQLLADQSAPAASLKLSALTGRSSRLAMGLLSAGLMLGGCERDEEAVTGDSRAGSTAGETAGEAIVGGETASGMTAGVSISGSIAGIDAALYGGPPGGLPAGAEAGESGGEVIVGGVEEAGLQSLYGAPPDEGGAFEGDMGTAGEIEEVDVGVVGGSAEQPLYGAVPAGEDG